MLNVSQVSHLKVYDILLPAHIQLFNRNEC